MAELVNLKTVKKRLARAKNTAQGAENAAKHGRSKEQKLREAAAAARTRAVLDAHRRDS